MLVSLEAPIERVLLGHSRADVRYDCRPDFIQRSARSCL